MMMCSGERYVSEERVEWADWLTNWNFDVQVQQTFERGVFSDKTENTGVESVVWTC